VSGIVACSALKHLYRHILKQGMQDINTDVLSATRNDCATATSMLHKHSVVILEKYRPTCACVITESNTFMYFVQELISQESD